MREDEHSPTRSLGDFRPPSAAPVVPPAIAHHRLIERIGAGGMGEVWVAEQEAPVRRRVAIKLIQAGRDSAQVLARFESERQALALMNHPNIARVFDAGTTAEGRPYVAMELVRGEPITTWCDRNRLDVADRLGLFMQVCGGVQHAHQKGVIHRDIKPSNVLVTVEAGAPACKIIDFGVAKAIAEPLTEQALVTRAGMMVGTPAYMSPEQADLREVDIDTRSDVYSLGVLLYELLVGVLPFDAKSLGSGGTVEMRRRLREEEPPRPSQRLSTFDATRSFDLATERRTDPTLLRRRLQGDLDWIVMKALEKDRTRRYGSPGELAADLERSLRDQPVIAGPPTVGYRMRKFVRRHRLGVAAAALVSGALVLGFALALAGFLQARRAEAAARQDAAAAEQTASFLIDLFKVSDPSEARGRTITARELLDRGAADIHTRLRDQPLLQARMMDTISQVYDRLGLYPEAKPFLEESLATRQRLLGEAAPETLQSRSDFLFLRARMGDFEGVEEGLRGILETLRGRHGERSTQTLRAKKRLGEFLYMRGKLDEAEPLLREVVEERRRSPGVDPRELYNAAAGYASLLQDLDRGAEAEALYREAEQGYARLGGSDDPDRLRALNDLATLLVGQDKLAEGERMFRDLLDAERRVYGPDHPETLTTLNNLGVVLSMEGRPAEAEPLYLDALDRRRRVLGDDHPDTLFSIHNMGGLLVDEGKYAEGERYRREAWERRRRVLGPEHPDTLEAANNLGVVLRLLGRFGEAESRFREAVDGRRRLLGVAHPDTQLSMNGLADVLIGERKFDEAIALRREVLATRRKSLPEGDPGIGGAMSRLGEALGKEGAGDEAESLLLGGFDVLAKSDRTSPTVLHEAVDRIATYYESIGKPALAAPWRARLAAMPALPASRTTPR